VKQFYYLLKKYSTGPGMLCFGRFPDPCGNGEDVVSIGRHLDDDKDVTVICDIPLSEWRKILEHIGVEGGEK